MDQIHKLSLTFLLIIKKRDIFFNMEHGE